MCCIIDIYTNERDVLFLNIYFDNAATTMVCKEAADAAYEVMTKSYGNPSSLHTMGMESEKILSDSRKNIATALSVSDKTVYFTSGGTESDNIAVIGTVTRNARKRKTIITSACEHPAVSAPFDVLGTMGYNVLKIKITPEGLIDLNHLESLLSDDVSFVSIMHINNETGCIMPLGDAIKLIRKKSPDAIIHSDMVQAFGKVKKEDVDIASISSHKIHGPKGVGALYIKEGIHINPTLHGGGQEKDIRPGTQNMPGIAGFGVAAKMLDTEGTTAHLSALKEKFINYLSDIEDIKINGENTAPHILNVSFKGTRSEVLLHMLESEGIMVSSGSACSSNKPSPSPVLTAMGLSHEYIDSAIRFSFSRYNTEEEIDKCAAVLKAQVPVIRRMMK